MRNLPHLNETLLRFGILRLIVMESDTRVERWSMGSDVLKKMAYYNLPDKSQLNVGIHTPIVGGWTNPFEKICSSNWIISPHIGVRIKNIRSDHLDILIHGSVMGYVGRWLNQRNFRAPKNPRKNCWFRPKNPTAGPRTGIHPWKVTWNLKISQLKKNTLRSK